jgi:diaminopropionate ammonia-lyase
MQGYTALVAEALVQLPAPPTHVFVQAGVGGIAAAAAAHLALALGEARPFFTVVDPARAACLYESARAGRPVKIAHGAPTVMAMLECYDPSPLAWRVLRCVADAFMTVEDAAAVEAMNRLARPVAGDPAIVAGESGGAGLAGLLTALRDPEAKAMAGLGPQARVLVVNTEGATDPARYRELVGLEAAEVGNAGRR